MKELIKVTKRWATLIGNFSDTVDASQNINLGMSLSLESILLS